MIEYTIPNPHPPEIPAFKRSPLHFFVSPPESGLNSETIPVLVLHGHGEVGASEYLKSLHHSLTSRRNVMVITVDYMGTSVMRGKLKSNIDEWCLELMNKSYRRRGLPDFPFDIRDKRALETDLIPYLKSLPAQFNQPNDPLAYFVGWAKGEHYDFGLVQTLDCLWALKALKEKFPDINWKGLTAIGSSHGGYLATMCAKFAPNTFALILNCYGWTRPYLPWMLRELEPKPFQLDGGIHAVYFTENYWRRDPESPCFLSEDRIRVRTQNDPEQLQQWRHQQGSTPTHYIFTQQIDDELHSESDKDIMVERMRALGFSLEYYKRNDPSAGVHYRSLDQNDKTSLKGLFFDFVTEERVGAHSVAQCDFERGGKIAYRCKQQTYEFDFSGAMPTYSVYPTEAAHAGTSVA